MCITNLHLSTLPCQHRYYTLVAPCNSAVSLTTCSRLQVQGWEQRSDTCPICYPDSLSTTPFTPARIRPLCSAIQSPTHSRRASAATSRRNSLLWTEGGSGTAEYDATRLEGVRNRRLSERIDSIIPPELDEAGEDAPDVILSPRVRQPTGLAAALAVPAPASLQYRPLTEVFEPVKSEPASVVVVDEAPLRVESEERGSESSESSESVKTDGSVRKSVSRRVGGRMRRMSCGLMGR